MTINEQFSRARNPDRWIILGQRLRALSVGHLELLGLQEISATPSPAELLLAVRICSMKHADAREWIYSGGLVLWQVVWAFVMRVRPIVYYTQVELFKAYIAQSMKLPVTWDDPKKTSTSSCPEAALLLIDLPSRYSAAEIMDMPFSEAHWLRLCGVAKKGGIEFIEDDVIEAARRMAKQVSEEEAAANGLR